MQPSRSHTKPVGVRRRLIRRWLLHYPRGLPLAIFALIIAITALSVYAIELGENERERAHLREEAKSIASAIERRGDASAAYLRAGAALFEGSGGISRLMFGKFVDELRLDSEYYGADGVGWARVLDRAEMPQFEAEMAEDYGVAVPIRAVARAPGDRVPETRRRVPVTFMFPTSERNRRALGFDMYSEPTRRAAMDEAERSVRPTASRQLVLVQEGKTNAPGFVIYMPVFMGEGALRKLSGFVYSPFNAADFIISAIPLAGEYPHQVQLLDEDSGNQKLLGQFGPRIDTGMTVIEPVNFANQPMTLRLTAESNASFSRMSMLALIFGLLVASLMLMLVQLLTRQALEDQAALAWLEEQDSIRQSLTLELNHRVKNTLANVLSIIALTRRRADDVESFADGLDGRVRSLSATHDLLTRSEWGTTPLRDVLEAELATYLSQLDWSIELNGPHVELAPNDALSLGLAMHELATNAARFGALSVPGGGVTVRWDMVGGNLVRIVWQEVGGPPVMETRERGFGLQLLERIVAHELGQPVEVAFDPAGVRCTMLISVRAPSDFAVRTRQRGN